MSAQNSLSERLREAREELGLTQQQVADWLGVRRPAVAEVESGSRAVKSDELVRLAALYGRSVAWLAEGALGAEEQIAAALFRTNVDVDPVLHREAGKLAKRCALVLRIEESLGKPRRSRVPEYADSSALSDWSRAAEHGKAVAYQERARLGIGDSAPLRDPWGVVEDAGIRVFPLELGNDHPIDGIFTRGVGRHACVGVNTDKWVFRQVFTVVHEYAHAILDGDVSGEACATSEAWNRSRSRYANRELRANQFAAVFLVPREALLSFLGSRGKLRSRPNLHALDLTPIELVRAQDHFGVSGEMLLWRLQNEGLIKSSERKELHAEIRRLGTVAIARSLGYDFRRFAQPFGRTREIALDGYAKGEISLGLLAEIFGFSKEDMRDRLHQWGIYPELADSDVLVGGGA